MASVTEPPVDLTSSKSSSDTEINSAENHDKNEYSKSHETMNDEHTPEIHNEYSETTLSMEEQLKLAIERQDFLKVVS